MIELNPNYFDQDEIDFIKWYDKIRGSGKSYMIPDDRRNLIRVVYGGKDYIRKLDMELKITKADKKEEN